MLTKANVDMHFYQPTSDEEREIPEDVKRQKMKEKMEDWCESVKSSLTKYGVTEEIILRMQVCSTGTVNDKGIPIYKSWKETLMKVCIDAQQDWDINEERRRCQIATRNIGAVAGGICALMIPVIGPLIGTTIGAIIGWKLGRESFEKSMKKSEKEKYRK